MIFLQVLEQASYLTTITTASFTFTISINTRCCFAVALIYYSIISSLQSPQASALGLIAQIQLRQIPGLPEPSRDDPTSHHKLSAHQPSSLRLQDVDHNFDNELLRRVFNVPFSSRFWRASIPPKLPTPHVWPGRTLKLRKLSRTQQSLCSCTPTSGCRNIIRALTRDPSSKGPQFDGTPVRRASRAPFCVLVARVARGVQLTTDQYQKLLVWSSIGDRRNRQSSPRPLVSYAGIGDEGGVQAVLPSLTGIPHMSILPCLAGAGTPHDSPESRFLSLHVSLHTVAVKLENTGPGTFWQEAPTTTFEYMRSGATTASLTSPYMHVHLCWDILDGKSSSHSICTLSQSRFE
ncbi:uncharacterized protein PADG_12208 [Paracoccidioides brasiliensis Pb18]|uniref:Uncharacterized protein n=1 Tax=Paracoccidioides brasiliensis (strain Pb18) TaxID=502780 RepID=A0A0A0HTK3_PARBD|nr:uncharacterized protein PADG_12208 [Paracoccidioides brasiliensis Pb18]KGM91638.1 hypothetical protein PADG_12208 [Paracoccidioides brasiliensis Pb18]